MSYRPHKRKRATTLKDITIAAIAADVDKIFRPGILNTKLRSEILSYLCFSPDLIDLPMGFLENMTELNFGGCVLPRGLLRQVAEEAPDLISLDLKQCSGHEVLLLDGLKLVCERCTSLRALDLVGTLTLTDSQIAPVHLCRTGISPPLILTLMLTYDFSSLTSLRLGGCIALSHCTLASLLEARGEGLLELDLTGCNVTTEVLEVISRRCKQLREFSCGYLDFVPPRALPLTIRSLPRLASLALPRSAVVCDGTLLLVGRHLAASLAALDITGCKRVTAEGILFLAWHCKELQSLKVRYCSTLTPEFHDGLPKLFSQIHPDKIERDRARFCNE